jgi:hypothetical protein
MRRSFPQDRLTLPQAAIRTLVDVNLAAGDGVCSGIGILAPPHLLGMAIGVTPAPDENGS